MVEVYTPMHPLKKRLRNLTWKKVLFMFDIFCSVIKKARDDYVKRLNGIYERNLNNVSIPFSHFKY